MFESALDKNITTHKGKSRIMTNKERKGDDEKMVFGPKRKDSQTQAIMGNSTKTLGKIKI